jgi:hypothetical protein
MLDWHDSGEVRDEAFVKNLHDLSAGVPRLLQFGLAHMVEQELTVGDVDTAEKMEALLTTPMLSAPGAGLDIQALINDIDTRDVLVPALVAAMAELCVSTKDILPPKATHRVTIAEVASRFSLFMTPCNDKIIKDMVRLVMPGVWRSLLKSHFVSADWEFIPFIPLEVCDIGRKLEYVGRTMVLMRALRDAPAGIVFPFLRGTCAAECHVKMLTLRQPGVKGSVEAYSAELAERHGRALLVEWAPKSPTGDHALLLEAQDGTDIIVELQWKNFKKGNALGAADVKKEMKRAEKALAAVGKSDSPAVVLVILCTNVGPELNAFSGKVLAGSVGDGFLEIPTGLELVIATEDDMLLLLGESQLAQCRMRSIDP